MKILILCTAVLLFSCSVSRNWNSNDNKGSASASFDVFNGRNTYNVDLPAKKNFYLKYNFDLKSGSIRLNVKSPGATVVDKEITGMVSDSIVVNNNGSNDFKIYVTGHHASGSFDIKYDTLANQ